MVPKTEGPFELKELRPSLMVVDPTPMALASSAGELAEPQYGPELPLEKRGTIPAASQDAMTAVYMLCP